MTIKQLLRKTSGQIDKLDAELLLAHVLKKTREQILAHPEQKIGLFNQWRFLRLVKKRKQAVPLAYLTGHKEFFGLDFVVNKNVLVPRPETEVLVKFVLYEMKNYELGIKNQKILLMDVGTGSGCIPISITKTLQQNNTSLRIFATDISRKALSLAKQNAKKHNVKIKFLHGNLLKPFLQTYQLTNLHTYKLIITANLPYLTEQQYQAEPSIHHEPKFALVAKKQGFALYEQLLQQSQTLISSFQFPVSFLFEIDPTQSKKIVSLIRKFFPKSTVKIKKDLTGKDRVVLTKIEKSDTI